MKYIEIPIWYSTILEGWIWINIHKSQQVWWWENENIIHSHPSYWLNFEGKSSLFWDPAMLRNTPLDPNGVLLSFPIQEDGPKQPINILGMGVETTDHVWCDALRCPLLQWRHDTQKHEAWSWQGFSSETSWQKECWLVVWIFFLFFHKLGIIIPTDFHIFQRGRYTTNQNEYLDMDWYALTIWSQAIAVCEGYPGCYPCRTPPQVTIVLIEGASNLVKSLTKKMVRPSHTTIDGELNWQRNPECDCGNAIPHIPCFHHGTWEFGGENC